MNETFNFLFEQKQYNEIMHLKIFVNNGYDELKTVYTDAINKHNQKLLNNSFLDAGFDIYIPEDIQVTSLLTMINLKIKCSTQMIRYNNRKNYCCYYLYPRSSLSKTPLRLANSTGIIDAGYRNNLIGAFDLINHVDGFLVEKNTRLLQICSPTLSPIYVELVETEVELSQETERNEGGFGSTGK